MKKLNLKGIRPIILSALLLSSICALANTSTNNMNDKNFMYYTKDTKISDVINEKSLGRLGEIIFPSSEYYSGDTLEDLKLVWYNNISYDSTTEVLNYIHSKVVNNEPIFLDIYSDEEKLKDSTLNNTGLFFFKGNQNAPFAICNAGGGFAYVGAIHDSFPHALEISKHGYNAFALIYRPNARLACQDLARAIKFIFDNAKKLEVDTSNYSLWGGSAGARMAAWIGSYGTKPFINLDYPKPSAVIMQYTGLDEYSDNDPPTYVNVGQSDYIANYKLMKARINAMSKAGIDTEYHSYEGLSHGFGLGIGTVAQGWINDAISFWERHMKN